MRDDQRHRVRVARADVDEVDVHAVDGRLELREGVQLRLALAPVVIRRPIADEFLELRELRALRLIGDRLLVGPAGRREALLQVGEVRVRHMDAEWEDCVGLPRSVRSGDPADSCSAWAKTALDDRAAKAAAKISLRMDLVPLFQAILAPDFDPRRQGAACDLSRALLGLVRPLLSSIVEICRTVGADAKNIDRSSLGDQTVNLGGILSLVKGYGPSRRHDNSACRCRHGEPLRRQPPATPSLWRRSADGFRSWRST